MMITFETSIDKSIFRRNRLVIKSTHTVDKGVLQNMFSGPGSPMLDVADAIVLQSILWNFIESEVRR